MLEYDQFLGVGWGFPPSFDIYSKSVELVQDKQDIQESLRILLNTTPGERIMELDYGCDLSPLAFQQLDLNLKTFMTNNIRQAILRYEPRIRVKEMLLEQEEGIKGTIHIHVQYIIKATNNLDKLVYKYTFI
jgi:phage baseplate assembly protein W